MSSFNLLWEGIISAQAAKLYVTELDEGIELYRLDTVEEGLLSSVVSGTLSFAKAHPFLTAAMASYAWDAVKKYNQAKKNALMFHTTNSWDRDKYWTMVKQLERDGSFKLVKHGRDGVGYFWEMHKK